MPHLSENELHAFLDYELSEKEKASVSEHLNNCTECRNQFATLEERARRVSDHLNVLAPEEQPRAEMLFQRVRARKDERGKVRFFRRSFRPAWAAVAATVVVMVFAWQSESVRVWATEFLNLFRVQQIAVVQIDPANVQRLQQDLFNEQNRPRIDQFFSDSAHVIKRGKPQQVSSVNEAGRVAGFGVRLPSQLSAEPRLHVCPAVDASLTLDVERLQGILEDAGRKDIQIPADLNGQTVNFNIPASVTAFYGKCPDPEKMKDEKHRERSRTLYPECKVLVQLPSPSVIAPPSLNVNQLGQAMLQLFGLSPEQAAKFSESIDWSSTLVVPLPMDHAVNFSEVEIDGVRGKLFTTQEYGPRHPACYNLLWIRDGILYSLMGHGSAQEAVAIANSLS